MFEIGGIDEATARQALKLAASKLPLRTKIYTRDQLIEKNGGEKQ